MLDEFCFRRYLRYNLMKGSYRLQTHRRDDYMIFFSMIPSQFKIGEIFPNVVLAGSCNAAKGQRLDENM